MPRPNHYIRQWRESAGLSQEALAAKIGRERSYLSRIERGERKYDQVLLESIAREVKCTAVDLLARDPKESEVIWTIYERLTPTGRKQLAEIARTFATTSPAPQSVPGVADKGRTSKPSGKRTGTQG